MWWFFFFLYVSVFLCISPGQQALKATVRLCGCGWILGLCPSFLSINGHNSTDFLHKVVWLSLVETIIWARQWHFSISRVELKGEKVTEDAGTSRGNLFLTTQYCQTTSPFAFPHFAHSWLCDKGTGCSVLPCPALSCPCPVLSCPILSYPSYVSRPHWQCCHCHCFCPKGLLRFEALGGSSLLYVTNICNILTRCTFIYFIPHCSR